MIKKIWQNRKHIQCEISAKFYWLPWLHAYEANEYDPAEVYFGWLFWQARTYIH